MRRHFDRLRNKSLPAFGVSDNCKPGSLALVFFLAGRLLRLGRQRVKDIIASQGEQAPAGSI